MNVNCIIGYTGLVGSNICIDRKFDFYYRSTNISEIKNKQFDEVICSGAPGTKWLANKEPENDLKNIKYLISCLEQIKARRFVLISTVDVYGDVSSGKNEQEHRVATHSYGKHRLMLEEFVKNKFENYHIVRLGALFGEGFKKNVLFDLIHQHHLHVLDWRSEFQWYYLKRINKDIQTIVSAGVREVNLVTEPLSTKELIEQKFKARYVLNEDGSIQNTTLANHSHQRYLIKYDLHTIYSDLFNAKKPYIESKQSVLKDIGDFLASYI